MKIILTNSDAIPAKVGIHNFLGIQWIPTFAELAEWKQVIVCKFLTKSATLSCQRESVIPGRQSRFQGEHRNMHFITIFRFYIVNKSVSSRSGMNQFQ
jgi:hypothetical protein